MPVNQKTLPDLFMQESLFRDVPANWHVVITDIRDSTAAVLGGMHETVNLIATGSIVTVLNIVFKAGITVPFFFGGDGATFIVPDTLLGQVVGALRQYRQNTKENFDLDLRVGSVPVHQIYQSGEQLRITKFRNSGIFATPVLLGNGLTFAEKLIKGEDAQIEELKALNEELDLSGMQCRWDKIAPPEETDEVVTLLVVATGGADQGTVFSKVMQEIEAIYGSLEKRQPITLSKLRMTTTFDKFGIELRAINGQVNPIRLLRMWFKSFMGYFYFKTETGRKYLRSMIEMSDTLVIDGKINTVMSGTEAQRLQLQHVLDLLEQKGSIFYGLYVSRESVMSCYVRNMDDGHIHFVDGGEGGYTKAAGLMKLKLQQSP